MKNKIQKMLDDVNYSLQFRAQWDKEHPEQVDEGRKYKMHYLDGRREALEEVLALYQPTQEIGGEKP